MTGAPPDGSKPAALDDDDGSALAVTAPAAPVAAATEVSHMHQQEKPAAASVEEEAPKQSIWLGLDASAAAGFAAGAGSFGTYELLKRTIPNAAASVLGPAAPADLSFVILLTACLLQAVAAAVCSSPFETGRAILMAEGGQPGAPSNVVAALTEVMRTSAADSAEAEDEEHRSVGAAQTVHATSVADTDPAHASGAAPAAIAPPDDAPLDVARLWDGLPALMGRELPFGITKLLVYATTQDSLLAILPAARERPSFALAVSLVSGIVAGFMGALVSHPADTVVTRLATGGFGSNWKGALDDVLAGAEADDAASKAKVLYVGVRERCISLAIVVTAQFILFDGLRAILAVSKEDLSLILDVFEDRLDFYTGWDEAKGAWLDAIDNLDDDLLQPPFL